MYIIFVYNIYYLLFIIHSLSQLFHLTIVSTYLSQYLLTCYPCNTYTLYHPSLLLLHIKCDDCDCNEKDIIKLFKTKYKHRKEIGNEYFEGDSKEMIKDIIPTKEELLAMAYDLIKDKIPEIPNIKLKRSLKK